MALAPSHSITSSARASNDGDTVRGRHFAIFIMSSRHFAIFISNQSNHRKRMRYPPLAISLVALLRGLPSREHRRNGDRADTVDQPFMARDFLRKCPRINDFRYIMFSCFSDRATLESMRLGLPEAILRKGMAFRLHRP
jgi:hypothetical protein